MLVNCYICGREVVPDPVEVEDWLKDKDDSKFYCADCIIGMFCKVTLLIAKVLKTLPIEDPLAFRYPQREKR